MKKLTFLVFFCLIGLNAISMAQIRVIESNTSVIKLLWEIEPIDTQTITNGMNKAVTLSFKGQNAVLGENGEFALPGYSLFVGVPPEGSVQVALLPTKFAAIQLASLPVRQKLPETAKNSGTVFSNPLISEPAFGLLKDIRTLNVLIRPGVYDQNSGILRVMTSGVITITFPANQHRPVAASMTDRERMIASLLCNYDIAKGWRLDSKLTKKTALPYPLENKRNIHHFRIGDGHSGLNEGTIDENGLMKITGATILSRFGMTAVSQVRLFASSKGELPDSLPTVSTINSGLVETPLLRIDRNHNGLVDSNDLFIAYVTGASDWVYREKRYDMILDRYDDYRHYWLTTGGNGTSVSTHVIEGKSTDTLDVFQQQLFFKKSVVSPSYSEGSLSWIWNKLSNINRSFSQQMNLPGLNASLPGSIRFGFRSENSGSVDITAGGHNWTNANSYSSYAINQWGDRRVLFNFNGIESNAFVELESFTVSYSRNLDLKESSSFTILSPSDSGIFTYNIKGADDENVYIFKVANNEEAIALIENVRIKNGIFFNWSDSGSNGARYLVYKESALLPLPAHEEYPLGVSAKHSIHDLRNTGNTTDFLIITHRDFIAAAESLAVHKEKMGFKKPVIVDITDIYRLFGGGDADPVAVRNFISFVRAGWSNGGDLDYVVLMGSAHYDVKQFKALRPAYLPAYYRNGDALQDDFFTTSFSDGSLKLLNSICIGRIPCETIDEAFAVVNKIREFEDPAEADFSDWRNRALFVADDDMQGIYVDPISSMTPHHVSSDRASDALQSKWKSLDLRKTFLFEYEKDNAGEKPGASRAIINEINNGVAYVNYFGHGSDNTWADEHIMTLSHIQQMVNRGRYPLLSSFSCSVGKFDQPGSVCLSAALVKSAHNGAIATISSSRASYAYSNEILAINFYSQLTDSLPATNSIGMMLNKAKIQTSNESNRTYVLLGDPSIKFVNSAKKIGLSIVDKGDKVLSQLKALQMVRIKGNVFDNNNNIDVTFGANGKAFVGVGLFNPPDSTSRKDGRAAVTRYILPGAPIFLGKTAVVNGSFEQTVLLPKNVAFNKKGVRLIAYSWQENVQGAGSGFRDDYIFNGSETDSTNDSIGPSITIRPVYDSENMSSASASFSDKISSVLPLKCDIDIYDPSGIDVVGVGPDEGLTMEVAGILSKRSINHKFQFKEGDFRRGIATIEFDEKSLESGSYTLTVTARDLLGYLSLKEFTIEVVDEQDLKLDHVFNFPNPVRMGQTTRFYFYPSNTVQQWTQDRIRIVVKIYTLSGKLIRVIKDASNGVVWDCKDQRGTALSPDVYLYQVSAYSSQKKKLVKSKIQKLVLHPPR